MLYRKIIAVRSEIHTKHPIYLWAERKICIFAFAKLRKATTSFAMSLCPSAWDNSASGDFYIWVSLRKSIEKIQV
jgi:hypothetical protein